MLLDFASEKFQQIRQHFNINAKSYMDSFKQTVCERVELVVSSEVVSIQW